MVDPNALAFVFALGVLIPVVLPFAILISVARYRRMVRGFDMPVHEGNSASAHAWNGPDGRSVCVTVETAAGPRLFALTPPAADALCGSLGWAIQDASPAFRTARAN